MLCLPRFRYPLRAEECVLHVLLPRRKFVLAHRFELTSRCEVGAVRLHNIAIHNQLFWKAELSNDLIRGDIVYNFIAILPRGVLEHSPPFVVFMSEQLRVGYHTLGLVPCCEFEGSVAATAGAEDDDVVVRLAREDVCVDFVVDGLVRVLFGGKVPVIKRCELSTNFGV